MTTDTATVAIALAGGQPWHKIWDDNLRDWVLLKGPHIVMLLIGTLLGARFVGWASRRITRRLDEGFTEGGALVRSESTKHRAAVASVISWVVIALIYVLFALSVVDALNMPMNLLAGPAAVLGAAVGFGARGVIEDLLAGFFILAEKQYGFGDLVELELASTARAEGTVEDVTLRVTKLRSSDGEVYTIGNGKVVKSTNLSKDWARAVVDIPVPTTADLSKVNDVLHEVCERALDEDAPLRRLLLDMPSLMGVESIEVDTVNLRMVARTLPGKQFEVGRRLRVQVVRALGRAGVVTAGTAAPSVATMPAATGERAAQKSGQQQ